MDDRLAALFAAKAEVLRRDEARESYEDVCARAFARQGQRRSFELALQSAKGFGLIAEIKRASPSLGTIVTNFDPATIARTYQRAGADAISVLTEESGFGGDLRYLDVVRAQTNVPILRKDFLTTPYQIAQAAAYGADAVLLIVAGLDDRQLEVLLAEAERFALTALVEVHDCEEALRAQTLGARVVGINNRDLRSFSVDLSTAEKLAPIFTSETLLVAESGIQNRHDVERLLPTGVRAFLIGETLMRHPDPVACIHSLRGLNA